MCLEVEIVTNLTESLTCEEDLKVKLSIINFSLQRLFMVIDTTRFIINPSLANKLAMEYKEVLKLKELLKNEDTPNLSSESVSYFICYCKDIISNYVELLDTETDNNGNLAVATELALNNKELNLKMFNFKSNMLKTEIKEVI